MPGGGQKKSAHAAEQDRPDVEPRAGLVRASSTSSPSAWSSSTRRAPPPMARYGRSRGRRLRARLEDHHLRGRAAPHGHDRSHGAGRAWGQVLVPTLRCGDVDPGQPARPQGPGRARGDRGGRSPAPVPSALLARLQPDRERLRQAEGSPAQGRRPHRRPACGCCTHASLQPRTGGSAWRSCRPSIGADPRHSWAWTKLQGVLVGQASGSDPSLLGVGETEGVHLQGRRIRTGGPHRGQRAERDEFDGDLLGSGCATLRRQCDWGPVCETVVFLTGYLCWERFSPSTAVTRRAPPAKESAG